MGLVGLSLEDAMKRLAWVFCVCLCGCVMSVMGAETPFSRGDGTWNRAKFVAAKDAAMASQSLSSPKNVAEVVAEEAEDIRKEGVPLTADPRYEQLFAASPDGSTDDGIYLVKDSIHVTDVVKDTIFATVTVIEAQPEETVRSTMEFCIDGSGKTSKKGADGTYAPLPENAPMAERLAEKAVLSAFSDDTQWEGFLQEMQEIAVHKAGLDKSETKPGDTPEGVKTEETDAQESAAPKEKPEPVAVSEETKAEPVAEAAGKKPEPSEKKSPKADTPPESPLWKEFEERVQSVLEEENSTKKEEERTRIEVVIPPDPDAVYEEAKVEPDNQTVTVSIQPVQ